MRTLITLFFFLLLPVVLQAQDPAAEQTEEIRRYTIEMIIFKYAQDVSSGNEIFPADKPEFDEPFMEEVPLIEEVSPVDPGPRVIRDVEFALLGRDEYTMGDIMSRLQRLEVYNPIMHFGWTQSTWPEQETQAIPLSSMARLPSGLNGTLKLYLNRFLHLIVDLELDAPGSTGSREERTSYGDYRTLSAFDDSGPVRYRIDEDRILRTGELRYFDHPKFGVLAKVSRVENQEAETAETELLGYPPE